MDKEEEEKPRYYSNIHSKSDVEKRYKSAKEVEELKLRDNKIKNLKKKVNELGKHNKKLKKWLQRAENQIEIEKENRVKNPKRPTQDDVEMTRFRFSVVEVETERDITWELPIFLN